MEDHKKRFDEEFSKHQEHDYDDTARSKEFEELKQKLLANMTSEFETNRSEKEKEIEDQFDIVEFAEEQHRHGEETKRIARFAPNGNLVNDELKDACKYVGLEYERFVQNSGFDPEEELIYTGHIEYIERKINENIHISTKYVPYIAARKIINFKKNSKNNLKKQDEKVDKTDL